MEFHRTDHHNERIYTNHTIIFSKQSHTVQRHPLSHGTLFQHYEIATYRIHLALAHIYSTILEHLEDFDHTVRSV